ncbi:MAG: 2-phospho-L-lactate transferase [Candidatus Hydrothermarchaeaceae archaeon]
MLTILSGGTGTPKLLQGLKEVVIQEELTVIVNTAEDCWLAHGHFSPDVDTVLYTLCDLIDEDTWHGIKGDSHRTHDRLIALDYNEALRIGDLDRATHIQRGELLHRGKRLTEAIDIQARAFGVKASVLPMSDDPVSTVIVTDEGEMDLHEFLIARRGKPVVRDVYIKGLEKAKACEEAVAAIDEADGIVIGPSNPISSIMPIVALPEIKHALINKRGRCVAVSPLVGGKAFSGPAGIFMKVKGLEVNSRSIAELYKDYMSALIVHETEDAFTLSGVKCVRANTIMNTLSDKRSLAVLILDLLGMK